MDSRGASPLNTLTGIISDNEAWAIMGKYTFELGGGGFKDEGPGAKLTVYGGYENMTFSNPKDQVGTARTWYWGVAVDDEQWIHYQYRQ